MVKLKLKDLVLRREHLSDIFNRIYPSPVTFKMMRLMQQIDNVIAAFEKSREVLFHRHGHEAWLDEEGNPTDEDRGSKHLIIKSSEEQAFNKAMDELLNSEVNVEFELIRVSELGDEHKLTPIQMATIKEFITE